MTISRLFEWSVTFSINLTSFPIDLSVDQSLFSLFSSHFPLLSPHFSIDQFSFCIDHFSLISVHVPLTSFHYSLISPHFTIELCLLSSLTTFMHLQYQGNGFPSIQQNLLDKQQGLKGIVSRLWEQLQWNPSDRSEEFRTAEAYFYSLLMPFSCFTSKKAFCGSFSFDSNSAKDE